MRVKEIYKNENKRRKYTLTLTMLGCFPVLIFCLLDFNIPTLSSDTFDSFTSEIKRLHDYEWKLFSFSRFYLFGNFCSFNPLLLPKIKIFKQWNTLPEDIIISQYYAINYDHIISSSSYRI